MIASDSTNLNTLLALKEEQSNLTKEAGTFMIITLIFIGSLLTCFGFFDKFVKVDKAGLIVPITGFAHAMMSSALEYKKEGLITGLGANMFKLAASFTTTEVVLHI